MTDKTKVEYRGSQQEAKPEEKEKAPIVKEEEPSGEKEEYVVEDYEPKHEDQYDPETDTTIIMPDYDGPLYDEDGNLINMNNDKVIRKKLC